MTINKPTIVATFANGEFIHRTTHLVLTFGWRSYGHDTKGRRYDQQGFARNEALALRSAKVSLRHFDANRPCEFEVAEVVTHDAKEFKTHLVTIQPFRIRQTYTDGRQYFISAHSNQDTRFATREAANDRVTSLQAADRYGTTYEIVDDREPAPTKTGKKPGRPLGGGGVHNI